MGHFNESRQYAAEQWTAQMNHDFDVPIETSIKASKVYRELNPKYTNSGFVPQIIVEPLKTDEAIHKYGTGCTALNFASFKYPGGGFIKGSMAQEEAICHVSFLYNVIGSERFAKDYEYNRSHLNNALYTNFGIYSPSIMFKGKDNRTWANIITVAAPNVGVFNQYATKGNPTEMYLNALDSRIKFILDIAEENETRTLILGAFGCGVFKNDPTVIAEHFKTALETKHYHFNKVVFAIPIGRDNNYNAFKKVYE